MILDKEARPETVTGIVTTYQREASIVENAISSMLAQTYPLLEIIVVDDNVNESRLCSQIQDMCGKYQNVIYIKQDGNKGACSARNLGIEHARGEYLAFLDDDDRWLPEKIEKQLQAFRQADGSVGLVYCCGVRLDENTNTETDYYTSERFLKDVGFEDLLEYDHIGSTSNPLIRRVCFETVGGFWEEQPARQDYEMWLRISTQYGIVGVSEKLFVHIIHSGEQITKNKSYAQRGYINIYERYKDAYRKNPRAMYVILDLITRIRDSNSISNIKYIILRRLTELRNRQFFLMRDKHDE